MIIPGTEIAKRIEDRVAETIGHLKHRKPGLAFVLVGQHPSSKIYIKMKKKKCQEVGIVSVDKEFRETISQQDLLAEIQNLNNDPSIDGILVQLPLPPHISAFVVMETISPAKDVDGFHPVNMGKLLLGDPSALIPCTPHGIHALLNAARIPLAGKHVVVVGRSNIVGKPLAALLVQKAPHCNATVTIAHSLTEHLPALCRSADVLVAAMGKPKFITKDMVKKGAVVIDVGINRLPPKNGKTLIVGDVDFEQVAPLCSHITPVPGGIGPMTIAMLLSNTLLCHQRNKIGN